MSLTFCPVHDQAGIASLTSLADEIWHECFPSLIGEAQVDYMIERFQSESALSRAIEKEGYEYFMMHDTGDAVGYVGIREDPDGRLFLSKLYLRAEHRGKGYASRALTFLADLCHARSLRAVWLTVNKGNTQAINVYRRKGFRVIDARVTDIGDGYVMDDYWMEWTLPESPDPAVPDRQHT